jgi:hypothetical protein
MPSFTVSGASELAEYLIPLTTADAVKIFDFMGSEDEVYAAVYGPDRYGKPVKQALWIGREGNRFYVVVDDYHPGRYGKAQIIVGK